MKTAYVWFNGPSARALHHIPAAACEIGCNYILDDRPVHHVCMFDRDVLNQIQIQQGVQYWTRKLHTTQTVHYFTSEVQSLCSGTLALTLALHLGMQEIFLFGFDWCINNDSIYDDQYRFRKRKPSKYNKYKIETINTLAQKMRINVVHDVVRDISKYLHYINVQDFLHIKNV